MRIPYLAVLVMECEPDLARRAAGIEGLVVGLKLVAGPERENEAVAAFRGRQRVGSQKSQANELIKMSSQLLSQNL